MQKALNRTLMTPWFMHTRTEVGRISRQFAGWVEFFTHCDDDFPTLGSGMDR